jgi:hypothetical protein
VPDILDNAYVVVDYENGARGMLDLCMFAEGSRNEQEICVVGDRGKVCLQNQCMYSYVLEPFGSDRWRQESQPL